MRLEGERLAINDLAKYSVWPKRIIGYEDFAKKKKTSDEIIREYNFEKWGVLLNKIKSSNGGLEDLLSFSYNRVDIFPILIENEIILQNQFNAFEYYIYLIIQTLKQYLPIYNLVELGAGSGNIILSLAKHESLKNINFYAGEYTQNGIDLIKLVAGKENIDIDIGKSDFTADKIIDFKIPNNSVLFTSFATMYVPKLDNKFINGILGLNPSIVINFEPCYEYYEKDTILGLMQKRYIKLNDYNTNMASLLLEQQRKGKIKILDVQKNIYGSNPFLPMSIIVWKPIT